MPCARVRSRNTRPWPSACSPWRSRAALATTCWRRTPTWRRFAATPVSTSSNGSFGFCKNCPRADGEAATKKGMSVCHGAVAGPAESGMSKPGGDMAGTLRTEEEERTAMQRTQLPRVEQLEDRTLPANFGFPWPNPGQITVSFVPDGTSLGGSWATANGPVSATGQSSLFSTLNGKMPVSVWQGEVLRALQTWANEVNINLVVVPDSGDPFGTTGIQQGDPRFGDIRIGAAPLSSSLLAMSVPYSLTGGTWVGDILF